MTRRFTVIGARGYIGAALVRAMPSGMLAAQTVSCPRDGYRLLRLERAEDYLTLPVSEGDVIFLTAAVSAPDVCAREYERAWGVNVVGTSEFVSSVIDRGGRVIFFSSDTVYGEHEVPFAEGAACDPAGEYAQMKYELERRFFQSASFKAIRLSYVFSREDKFTRYLLSCNERKQAAELFHPFVRAIIHRDDVVNGAIALAASWNEVSEKVINFGGPGLLSRVDFAEALRDSYCPDLKFTVREPEEEFFRSRPRVIAMTSPVLKSLLNREPRSLVEAVRLEFASTIDQRG